MRDSTLRTPDPDASTAERAPLRRRVLWTIVAVLLLAGIALTFIYGRGIAPLL